MWSVMRGEVCLKHLEWVIVYAELLGVGEDPRGRAGSKPVEG